MCQGELGRKFRCRFRVSNSSVGEMVEVETPLLFRAVVGGRELSEGVTREHRLRGGMSLTSLRLLLLVGGLLGGELGLRMRLMREGRD